MNWKNRDTELIADFWKNTTSDEICEPYAGVPEFEAELELQEERLSIGVVDVAEVTDTIRGSFCDSPEDEAVNDFVEIMGINLDDVDWQQIGEWAWGKMALAGIEES